MTANHLRYEAMRKINIFSIVTVSCAAVKRCGVLGLAMGAAPKAFRNGVKEWSGSGTADVATRME